MRHRRPGPRAFTIVELVVAIGVLAVIISILLPSVARAREQAKRVNCGSNLRQIGVAATAFAQRNNGVFPMTYMMPDVAMKYSFRFPLVVGTDASYAADDRWRTYGTPIQEWKRYGAADEVWGCPTTGRGIRYYEPGAAPPEWGMIAMTDYMYVGGLCYSPSNLGKSTGRWGIAEPARTLFDKAPAEKILAADAVFYTGGPGYAWDAKYARRYQINHPAATDATKVDYQAILYADGHVQSQGREAYPTPLTTGNYSLRHDGGKGAFFYWGPTVSYTPGKRIPPPTTAPTTPTTPTTPIPPSVPPPPPPPPPLNPNPLPV
ncbi:MAG TPA: type II secretion system protein [Humisphaera sp.]